MEQEKPKTLGEVIKAGTAYLASRDVYQPRQACELLAGRLLNCKRLELLVKLDLVMTEPQLAAMRRGVKRLAEGEPVQYVTGQVDFMGRIFKVDKRALIPRPETEILVETVLKTADIWASPEPLVLDVGTGSGCIAVTLAAEKPGCRVLALDASREALELAAENAAAHNVLTAISFAGPDLSECAEPDSADAIVANLPYVTTSEYEKLPVHIRKFEPRLALDGGPDGLDVIRGLVLDTEIVLKVGGMIFLEIGASQGQRALALLKENGFVENKVIKDLAGLDRIVCGRKA